MARMRIAALVAVTFTFASCSTPGEGRSSNENGIVNVLGHADGAEIVNVHCSEGSWQPLDVAGRPVPVDVDGAITDTIALAEGEEKAVTVVANGRKLSVLCVPEGLPVPGKNWIGRWATLSVLHNSQWNNPTSSTMHIVKALISGTTDSLQDEGDAGDPGDSPDPACGEGRCEKNYQLLVDQNGVIRWYRSIPLLMLSALEYDPVRGILIGFAASTEQAAPGVPAHSSRVILYTSKPSGDATVDPAGKAYPSIGSPDGKIRLDGHDYAVLPNGNYLFIGYEALEGRAEDRSKLFQGSQLCSEKSIDEYRYVIRTRVLEYTPEQDLVRVWRSEDHMKAIAGPSTRAAWLPQPGGAVCALDIEHANTINVAPDGSIVVGMRNSSAAAIGISWPDGKIAWSLGGDHANSLRVTGDPLGGPQAAHDAIVTRTDEGTFLHFMDNNTFRGPARYVRYRLDLTARTAELVAAQTLECSYGECYSLLMGSVNVLSESPENEVLLNPGGAIGDDIRMALDGELLHYRGDELLRRISLGDWWAFRVAILPEEPWRDAPQQ